MCSLSFWALKVEVALLSYFLLEERGNTFHLFWLHFSGCLLNTVLFLYVCKGLNGRAQQCISDLVNWKCFSPLSLMLTVPWSCLKLKGDCALSVAAPQLWNDLVVQIRLLSDADSFKTSLKKYIFSLAFGSM